MDYWAKKYGPLFSIWMGTQLFVVISDPHIAWDLLVTHGAVFSSRKRYFLKVKSSSVVEVSLHRSMEISDEFIVILVNARSRFRFASLRKQHRRLATQVLNPRAIKIFTSTM